MSSPQINGPAPRRPGTGTSFFHSLVGRAGDEHFVFGRERLIAELIGRLAGAAFLGVVGPSGSGKSSAIRAGLVPAFEAGVLPGSEQWTRVLLRPGERAAA